VKLVVADAIWDEIARVARWYDEARAGLGGEFVDAVDAALATVVANPRAWATWPGFEGGPTPLRRFVMERFPYAIGYRLTDDAIVVATVAHARRKGVGFAAP
jgi:toxin ParE1/3/4